MNFVIHHKDPLYVKRLKLIYLVPLALLTYPIQVMRMGMDVVGTPAELWRDIVLAWKGK